MKPSLPAFLLSTCVCLHSVAGIKLEGRVVGRDEKNALRKRVQMTGFGSSAVDDASDVTYTTTMNIGGRDISVLIDTGSSDLWATGQVPNSTPTNFTADVTYAQGDAGGYISIAPVQFAGYTIPDQTYINVTSGDPPSVDGLIGLGPYMGSTIRTTVGNPSADPVLNRIFALNTSTPNFLSFILGRSSGPSQPFSGEITVGEVIEGFEDVTKQPKNEVQVLPTSDSGDQHWALSLDTFTGPDGKSIPYTTTVPDESKPVAVLDSGFSLPQIPGNISDAIYGRVQGAQWLTTSPVGPVWQIPCEQELNISVTIGGKVYPIHPLDVSLEITINPDIPNICVGAFQPSTIGFSNAAQIFDMVLGMSFLRNTYTLINFGDFVDANSSVTADPYIQLLSLTDPGQAHQDFVSTRLNNVDTTSDPQYALLPASEQQSSGTGSPANPNPSNEMTKTKNKITSAGKKIGKVVLIAIVAGAALLLITLLVCFFVCCRKRGGKNQRMMSGLGMSGVGFKGTEVPMPPNQPGMGMGGTYAPISYPAPGSHAPQYGGYGYTQY